MPRKPDKNSNLILENNREMEVEENEEHANHEEIKEIDVKNIDQFIVDSESGYSYEPEKFKECFLPQNDLAKEITSNTLKVALVKMIIKSSKSKTQFKGANEIYIINNNWYKNWKNYAKYGTVKRCIRAYSTYKVLQIKYTPSEKMNPGPINNNNLYIKNNLNGNDGRNILISKSNDAFDTKVGVKLISRDRFNLLKDFYKCDKVIRANCENADYNTTELFSVHLNVIFIPTIDKFKEVNDENYSNFCDKYNIIYDTYFKLCSKGDDIKIELNNILKEKPELLLNMGATFITEGNEDEIMNHFNLLKIYIPHSSNTKTSKEILDFILRKETIEKIKNNVKISSDEIPLKKTPSFHRDIRELFHIPLSKKNNNIDDLKNGFIIIEYIPKEKDEEINQLSIFDEEKNLPPSRKSSFEMAAPRSYPVGHEYHSSPQHKKDYNLDDFPLNEKENKNGLVGLNNLGNTCYMNTGLQCLSNCELLTKYFLGKFYENFINKENPIGSGGEIVEKYSQLINHLWYGDREYISPIQFKNAFGKMYTAFNGSRQQDTQEFISYLLDSLHEDLNKVKKKPYIEEKDLSSDLSDEEIFKIKKDIYLSRNQSFIADLIYGFYKSTVFCPEKNCNNITKSFEPFNMITLSLVNEFELRKIEEFKEEQNKKLGIKELTVTFIPFKINYKPLCFKVRIKKDTDVFTFKKKIEIITKFNLNTLELYKIQGNEYVPMKSDMYLMEDFLKGEKKIYLVQIPPYVFGKKLDYFDKIYSHLIGDMDSFFLEEEKYEGNDLYKIYGKKEKKARTDDDLKLSKGNSMHIEEKENGLKLGRRESNDDSQLKLKNEMALDNINTNTNNTTDDLKLSSKKSEKNDDVEMEDKTLHLDKTDWIKAEFYNYSYKIPNNEKNTKKKSPKEERIAMPRIIYINKNWTNAQLYDCIMDMLEGTRNDLPEIKEMWFKDLKDILTNLDQVNKSKAANIYEQFENLTAHPLMVQYLRFYNFEKENIMKKGDKHENSIFIYDPEEYKIKQIIEDAEKKGNSKDDIELLFKIIWKENLADDYKEGVRARNLEKSDKLEEILKNQKEDEFLKKNNMTKAEKDSKNTKNKKLNLDELLANFNQIEKLSKDNEWFCPKCKKLQLADKKMEIYSISEIVIIHLKRFRNNRKIENIVDFPIEGLDLTKYLPTQKEKYIYDLFAVANHVGGLQGGHYYAYCKNSKDGEWYEFNDSHVSKIDKNKVCSETAYVLFYSRRREEKINEEELFKKPFVEIDISKYKSN